MIRDTIRGKGRKLFDLRKKRRVRITGLVILLFFAVFTITGFLILPPYVKKIAVEKLSEQLDRQVSLSSVMINPYTLAVTFKGFSVLEADGKSTFVSFDRLDIDMDVMSIFTASPVVDELRIEGLYISIIRTDVNKYNFSDILKKLQETKPGDKPAEKSSEPMTFSVDNIQIITGKIDFDDRPVSTRHTISQINLTVPFISNKADYRESFVQPVFSAVINGTPVDFKGGSKFFADSRETSFDISLRDIDIPYYLGYTPAQLNVKAPSGKLDIEMKLSYSQFRDRKPLIGLTGEIRLKDLIAKLKSTNEDLIKIPAASVKDIEFDMETNRINIGYVSTENGWISVLRAKDGKMNLSLLMLASPRPSASQNPGPKAEPKPDSVKNDKSSTSIVLKELAVSGYKVMIVDESQRRPVKLNLDEISFNGKEISTAKDVKSDIEIAMKVEQKGSLSVKGKVSLDPVTADVTLDIKSAPLKPFNPFIEAKSKAMLADGALNLNGNVVASMPEGREPDVTFKGKIQVNKFSMLNKATAEELLKWETFNAGDINFRLSPMTAHIREVSVSNFYSRVVINADQTINLQEVFKADSPAGQASQKTALAAPAAGGGKAPEKRANIKIDKVTLQGGKINLTDNFIKPRFSGNLLEIGGHITGLSSDETKLADVDLRGMYERYAPLTITGKINPLKRERYIDLKLSFREMDLAGLTPYSGRYAGYTIEKGKLSFDLEYLIVGNKIDAKNKIFLDQLTLGDKVESPDATSLPVKLGIALLKDGKGEINLDIPVSGNLDDPEFSVGGIIWKVIVNLFVKAATSPFSLLGAVFGGGEQLSYAEFDYGAASITPETQKKLDTLIKALSERPGLKLDITGMADPEKDREGLKRYMMMRKVKAQKIKDMLKKDKEAQSLESVEVSAAEYPEYLKRAYKAEKFPKPRNIIGMAKSLPVPEMEKLMITNTPVTEDDLRTLAKDRALVVRDYLLKSKKIGQERIFMVESRTLAAEKKENAKNSRVDFRLK
jgi:hypothetical protein